MRWQRSWQRLEHVSRGCEVSVCSSGLSGNLGVCLLSVERCSLRLSFRGSGGRVSDMLNLLTVSPMNQLNRHSMQMARHAAYELGGLIIYFKWFKLSSIADLDWEGSIIMSSILLEDQNIACPRV